MSSCGGSGKAKGKSKLMEMITRMKGKGKNKGNGKGKGGKDNGEATPASPQASLPPSHGEREEEVAIGNASPPRA